MTARKPLKINGFPVITLGKKPGEGVCQAGTRFAKFFAVVFTLELSRKVEPENTQNITAAIFADGVERSGTESANFGGYAASPRAASRNCSGGSPSGFDVYTLKRL